MKYLKIGGQCFYNMMVNANNKLEEQKDYVNSLNVFPVPDGDTGTNMSMTFRSAVSEIENMQDKPIGEIARKLSRGALMGARGNSGVILSQIFRGIAKGLEEKDEVNAEEFANSLMEGSKSAYKAVMRPTEGTILTVIRVAGESAVKSNREDISSLLGEVCEYSKNILNKTPEMLPVLKKAKVVDAGGMGLLIILQGMYEVLKEDIQKVNMTDRDKEIQQIVSQNLDKQDIKFGYCTEFFIISNNINVDNFKTELEVIGDSMVVVKDDDIVKVHIHTNDPGMVLSKAIKLGELSKIKIDNMREQHRHVIQMKDGENIEIKKYAFIAVAMGEGIKNIFEDLGVDFVIEGGQTMNPSTQDILDCISKMNAENIFVLPNNKNIIMAANQAAELSDKKVKVITTKTIPQGITAVTEFNPNLDLEDNIQIMNKGIENVQSGSVTYAVRDTEIDGKFIKEGNILGLVEGKITNVGEDIFQVCENIISTMVNEDSELITLFYGKDCKEEKVKEFIKNIQEKYENADVQYYSGQQPLYYFIVSVE
ncbi:DAK2 domain-containing protein [Clostridiaceae bacterium UIB06]|uniref:DAK2 domain-containing protein n=1 Tax=Clostridium thailandense TaxID=2794346 RepID=A0A949TWX7_9CLOT|nr:DAK2 domain-containing protein [Clostridium thailandense]MBV7271949.1 DAK2 domain-containing protein [Clostridium thailandense]MCH5137175.1 DAK2 domain-containing protein [Clostridiaceae bacterium UIB06]